MNEAEPDPVDRFTKLFLPMFVLLSERTLNRGSRGGDSAHTQSPTSDGTAVSSQFPRCNEVTFVILFSAISRRAGSDIAPPCVSDHDPFDFIKRDVIRGPVVEL